VVVDEQRDRVKLPEECCPSCGDDLADDEAKQALCRRCDEQLERELAAYLGFVAVSRESA
jgi:predicted amidophosphoribosyltransferase